MSISLKFHNRKYT